MFCQMQFVAIAATAPLSFSLKPPMLPSLPMHLHDLFMLHMNRSARFGHRLAYAPFYATFTLQIFPSTVAPRVYPPGGQQQVRKKNISIAVCGFQIDSTYTLRIDKPTEFFTTNDPSTLVVLILPV